MIINESSSTKNSIPNNNAHKNSIYNKSFILGDESPGLNSLLKTPEYRLYGDIQSLPNRALVSILAEVEPDSNIRKKLYNNAKKVDYVYNRILEIRKNM